MTLSGKIQTFPLTDLLQWFSMVRKTGVLSIVSGPSNVNLFLREGVLVTATSSDPSRRIGQYLLSRGYIDEQQLKKALDLQDETAGERRLGAILCAESLLSREQLHDALAVRTREIVYDLFLFGEGVFHFNPQLELPEASLVVELNFNLDSLVMEGIRRKDEWDRIREILPGDAALVGRVEDASAPIPDEVAELGGELVDMLTEPHSIAELIMASRRSPFDVYYTLYCLVRKEVVAVLSTGPVADPQETAAEDRRSVESEIRSLIGREDFTGARQRIEALREKTVDPVWLNRITEWLDDQESHYLQRNIPLHSVPVTALDMARSRDIALSAQEGFLLSRLGEGLDVKALCQIMPLSETMILRILDSLRSRGLVRIDSA